MSVGVLILPALGSAQVQLMSGFNFGQFLGAGTPNIDVGTYAEVGSIRSNFGPNSQPGPEDGGAFKATNGIAGTYSDGRSTLYFDGTNGSSDFDGLATGPGSVQVFERGALVAINHNTVNPLIQIHSGDDNNAALQLVSSGSINKFSIVTDTTGFTDFDPGAQSLPNDFNFTFAALANTGSGTVQFSLNGVNIGGAFNVVGGEYQAFDLDLPTSFYGNANATLVATVTGDLLFDHVQLNGNFGTAVPTTLTFWKGGSDVWTRAAANWRDSTGATSAAWTTPDVAIFRGTAGTVTVDSSGGEVAFTGAKFEVNGYVVGAAAGSVLTTNTSSTPIQVSNNVTATISAPIAGTGGINKTDAGTLTLTGTNTYTGATTITAGTLNINGDSSAAGAVTVASGGKLGGTGTASDVTVANGGTLVGQAGNKLTMSDLVLNPTSNINVTLGATSTTELFKVNGDLTLDGTLNVTGAAGFGAGLYRLFNYSGSLLANNTLVGGTMPTGFTLSEVQTSVANQVNAVFAVGSSSGGSGEMQFWKGTGAWTAASSSTLWTDANGTQPGSWKSGMAIFQAPAGTVTVDTAGGPVGFTGLQFATSGYTITGGTLTTNTANTALRVGDGSAAGTGMTATISSVIAGTGSIDKTDLGKLVLTGTNTYSGGTKITAGTLQIGAGGTTGSIVGNIANNGTLSVNRSNAVSFSGIISGTGALTQDGKGTTTLTGANAYTGTTTVNAGTLLINGNQATAAGAITVRSGATIGGSGTTGGSVTVQNGGHIQGTSGTTFTMGGLSFQPTAQANFILGAPSADKLLQVNSDVRLDGYYNISDGGTPLTPGGTWRLMDATGTITNTFQFGSAPVNPGDLYLTTPTGNQLSLTFVPSVADYWTGGAGTWSATGGTSWKKWDDTAGGAWQSRTATFRGTGGNVVVDNAGVNFKGAQFLTNNYSVTGGTLTTDVLATLQVGNGSTAGAATSATISSVIAGSGGIIKTDLGTLTLSGNNTYTGATAVSAGTLLINGTQHAAASPVIVYAGATLGGTGSVGNVTVSDDATLLGQSGSTFTMTGLTLTPTSHVAVTLGAPSTNTLFQVNGSLTLAGLLDITGTTGFGPGLYRLFNYTGSLINTGMSIGSTTFSSSLLPQIQTSVANQINLVVDVGPLPFWTGGNGTWSASASGNKFGPTDGSFQGAWKPGMAIFQGAPGTVTVDNSAGAVTFTGIQFAVDGYNVTGGALTTTTANTVVRVGDSTSAGSSMKATIASAITGTGGIEKNDLGTLILSGENTYSGGTTIANGTLQIGAGGTTGSVTGNITNRAALSFNRSDTIVYAGVISGTGTVTQAGSGTTTLTGNNTYTGGTTVSAGTLQIGAGGTTGSVTGNITNNANVTFNRSDAATYAGVMGGTGSVTLAGTGTTTLTGNNTYTGNTTVSSGTLQIGAGGTSGSVTGNILNNGTVNLNRSDALTIGGTISGTGSVNQIGSGTTSLTGNNTYSGGTTISAGTLQLGSGGTSGSVLGNIVNNGTLAVNRSDNATLGNTISGSGAVVKQGTGSLTLTGPNLYSGGTTVNAGVLEISENGNLGANSGAVTLNGGTLRTTAGITTTRNISVGSSGGTLDTGPNKLVLQGTLGGSGALNKTGTGTLTVSGNNTITGATTITQGGIVLDGSSLAATSIEANGRLSGNGTIRGALANKGALSPGASAGKVTVEGNYSQTATGTYEAEIGSPTSYDKLVITGTASLEGKLAVTGLNGYVPDAGQTFRIIEATSITGKFSSVTSPWSDISPMLRFEALYGTKQVDLSMTQLPFAGVAGATPHQVATGRGVDGAIVAKTIPNLQKALNGLSTLDKVKVALNELSPLRYNRWFNQAVYNADATIRTVESRMEQVQREPRGSLWTDVVRRESEFDATPDATAAKGRTSGIVIGGDARVTEDLQVGILFGYTGEKLDLDEVGSLTDTKRFTGSLYTRFDLAPVSIEAVVGGSHSDLESERVVAIPGYAGIAESKNKTREGYASLRVAYALQMGGMRLTPYVGANYVSWSADVANETGAREANLKIHSQSRTSLASRAGFTLAFPHMGENVSFIPKLDFAWRHEFRSGLRMLTAEIGGVPFSLDDASSVGTVGLLGTGESGDKSEDNGFIAGLGFDVTFGSRLTTYVRVSAEKSTAADKAIEARAGTEYRF